VPSVEEGLASLLRRLASKMSGGVLDVDALDDAGGIALAARYLSGREYFYVIGNALYNLAEAVGEVMRVASFPFSSEYRSRLEEALDSFRTRGADAMGEMARCVEAGDECCAMRAAARVFAVADELAGVARNLKAVMPFAAGEEE